MSSIEEAINHKFVYAGGPGRCMLQMTTDKIGEEIDDWIEESDDNMKLLSFSLGPKSSQAKTTCSHLSKVREWADQSRRVTQSRPKRRIN